MNKAKQKSDVFQRSNIPLYIQVASTLRRRIEQGRWKLGDKISSIPELEAEFGVARIRRCFHHILYNPYSATVYRPLVA